MNATNRGRWVAPDGREWSDVTLRVELEDGRLKLLIRSDEAWVVRNRAGTLLHLVPVPEMTDRGNTAPE